jgi:Na+-transporting NADH:ubiquinone oxidoreductase subunit C
MTLLLGSILAFTSESLKERQASEREFERKRFILSAALGRLKIDEMAKQDRSEVENIYDSRVVSFVVNANGEKIDGLSVGDISIAKEYKKPKEERQLPIYTIMKQDVEEIEYFVLPIYGNGLWDNIWGYLSLQEDMNTVQGIIFDHKAETPGLGARITESGLQARYQGKKLYDEANVFQSVVMQKGETGNYDSDPHKVNGMTGATITGVGVNQMIEDYVKLYENYLKTLKK